VACDRPQGRGARANLDGDPEDDIMTNRDRDAVAARLREIATRLAEAPDKVQQSATKNASEVSPEYSEVFTSAYRLAGMDDACRRAADEIGKLVEHYLTPRTSKVTDRGRR
jgi:hypothetical protein